MRKIRPILGMTALACLTACTSTKVISLASVPNSATVKVTADHQEGPQKLSVGKTPVSYPFKFGSGPDSGPMVYDVEFSRKGYETKTIQVSSGDPRPSLEVTLDKELFREIPRHVLVVSADQGYTLETQMVRAWVEDIEREGMPASSIFRLSERQSTLGLALSHDGKKLYFSLAEEIQAGKEKTKAVATLRSVNTSGGGITQITSGQWLDATPTCSRDGKYIIFSSNRMQSYKPDLFRISTEGTGGIAVIRQTTEGASYQPSIGADGLLSFTYLPLYRGGLEGTRQIWTIGGANNYPTQLRLGTMPAISTDGQHIAYVGEDNQLWVMPTSGQNPSQLTCEAIKKSGKKSPSWSADGKYILFSSDVGRDKREVANYDIWIIRADGTGLRQLTTNGSEDDCPIASPDGKHIYFVSNRGFKEGIWRIPFPQQ